MQRRTVLTLGVAFIVALIAVGSIQLFAVGTATSAGEAPNAAASLEPANGANLHRIRLSPLAAQRIGLQTDIVRTTKATGVGTFMKSVPYSALLYDDQGATWVYTRVKPLVFVRARVDVVLIDGQHVILSKGPELGTKVATLGAAELYGTEFETADD
jgi:hypothetical protein